MVTEQLTNMPTRGLPIRRLVISRTVNAQMPPLQVVAFFCGYFEML